MKVPKILLNAAFFILLFNPLFSQEKTTESASADANVIPAEDNSLPSSDKFSKKTSFFERKYNDEFRLQTNVDFQGAFNFTGIANYPLAKISVDMVEAWFNRLGVGSSIAFDFGLPLDNTNIVIAQLFCPGVTVSWDIGSGLYATTGISLQHTWYVITEEVDAAGVDTKTVTTVRTYGFSIPLKLRYAITKQFGVTAEYTFSAHPWIPASSMEDSSWLIENTLSAGVSLSFPHNF